MPQSKSLSSDSDVEVLAVQEKYLVAKKVAQERKKRKKREEREERKKMEA